MPDPSEVLAPFLSFVSQSTIVGLSIFKDFWYLSIYSLHSLGIAFLSPKYKVKGIFEPLRSSNAFWLRMVPSPVKRSGRKSTFLLNIVELKGTLKLAFPQIG